MCFQPAHFSYTGGGRGSTHQQKIDPKNRTYKISSVQAIIPFLDFFNDTEALIQIKSTQSGTSMEVVVDRNPQSFGHLDYA